MLFKAIFHEGIRRGDIGVTFRAWKTPKVRIGSSYKCPPIGSIRVDAIDEIPLSAIREGEARASGFSSADDLRSELRRISSRRLTGRSTIYRVRFHFDAALTSPPKADTSRAGLDTLADRLERMDRLARRRPWTRRTLSLIAAHPGVAASRLASRVDRETRAFKADVRKLKGLGLSRSLSTGYELSTAGKALLRHLGRRS